jgi:hypothetical protein
VYRSTDQGSNWKSIGGPSVLQDSRDIVAINDNVVFAIDSNGTVWVTLNSGGDSIRSSGTLSTTPNSLFDQDTVYCDSLTRTVQFNVIGCAQAHAMRWSIIGEDSSSFKASNFSKNSISLTLYANYAGSKHAQLLVYVDNGEVDTVMLSGQVIIEPNTLSLSSTSLFSTDTISCGTITRTIVFTRTGCNSPLISSHSFVGQDSASYGVSYSTYNSMGIDFFGARLGDQHANLLLALSDGSVDTVSLSGYVSLFHSPLAFSIPDVHTDTLGATVEVPITINGLERTENIDLVLHYDGTVVYLGSFSPTGIQLDREGEQWAGRSELAINGAMPDSVLGYAKFTVFNDSDEAAHASFDSVNVLTQIAPCEYSMPAPVISTITTVAGCAIPMLSQLIHFGVDPLFRVVPNPSNGTIWITSGADLGAATIQVFDMLGEVRSERSATVQKDQPLLQTLPDADGVYTILVKTSAGMSSLRVVEKH